MANSTAQFNGEVKNIESNINKVDTYDSTLEETASKQKYPSIECLKDLVKQILPIGIILSFDTPVNPNELYGGTWERIKGRFIWGIEDGEQASCTGGTKRETLTESQMPSHKHKLGYVLYNIPDSGGTQKWLIDVGAASSEIVEKRDSDSIASAGGNQPHNNMPPYYGAYTWRRVA